MNLYKKKDKDHRFLALGDLGNQKEKWKADSDEVFCVFNLEKKSFSKDPFNMTLNKSHHFPMPHRPPQYKSRRLVSVSEISSNFDF